MRTLILDSNYICHAVFHSMPSLTFDGKYTEVIYGFIKKVIMYTERFPSDNIVFTWDSKTSIRKEVYPNYKKQRVRAAKEQSEEEKHVKRIAYLQFDDIRDCILESLGFSNNYMQDGYEADDLMASIVNNNPDYEFIIVTTDKDIYQLLSNRCRLYNPMTKTLMSVETFKQEYSCHPSLWGKARSISGCSTDNVSGVKGIAEKTAILYLTDSLKKDSKKYHLIKSAEDQTKENEHLIILPLDGTESIKIKSENSLTRIKFIKMCETYGFKSLTSKNILDKWDSMSVKINAIQF